MKKNPLSKVWTILYSPFSMGGDVNKPVYTLLPVKDRKVLLGLPFFSFALPNGKIRVCEDQTGGIVSDSWDALESAIDGCDAAMLQGQIDANKTKADRATFLTVEYFFTKYKG